MKILRVSVTQEDIDKGEPGNSKLCPIALALTRKGFTRVGVTPSWSTLKSKKGVEYEFNLPEQAQIFIMNFDGAFAIERLSKYIRPFKFWAIARKSKGE